MYLVTLAFLLVFILYFLYQDEINYYLEYSAARAIEAASNNSVGQVLYYYKYHML